jgi:tRNA(His) guanylyltransferase
MKPEELELRMRGLESFRSLQIATDAWTIIRLDGRAFTGFTAKHFDKPFDERLRDLMIEAAAALLLDFQGLYAHTFSDEISVVFAPDWNIFSGRVEKLVSLSAGLASAAFTRALGDVARFDSRIWQSGHRHEVLDYFRWRQSDTARCALHGWCYWTLRHAGIGSEQAVGMLDGQNKDQQKLLLYRYGIEFDEIPLWQRRGVGLYWQDYEKPGYDPIKGESVTAQRRRIARQMQLPAGDAYSEFLDGLLP